MAIPSATSQDSNPETWHTKPTSDVVDLLQSSGEGLASGEAAARLATHGPNQLPSSPPVRWWVIAIRQFRSPLIYILALAAVVSIWIKEFTDASFIAGVLVLNAVIGGVQEWKAERSSRALQKLLRTIASVERDGEICEIDAEHVVVGDIVWLESGVRVPADMRLLSAHGLKVDESLLTGESLAVTKDATWIGIDQTPLADRVNMVWAGSVVTHGRAKGVVVATGSSTHVGQLALDVMSATGGAPPLLVRLERFTRMVGVSVLVGAALVVILGVAFRGSNATEMFVFAVALAVSAIPEGLPVAITVALSVATARMAKRGVIVRKLGAVEGLGSCTFIATDKTGTLTCNELTVQHVRLADGRHYEITGSGFSPTGDVLFDGHAIVPEKHAELMDLMRASVLCNEADLHRRDDGDWHWRGDPTDVALLTLGAKTGWSREKTLDNHRQLDEIPFEPEHQYAASFHEKDDETFAFVKGAPERVIAMCRATATHEIIDKAKSDAEAMASQGLRVLAIAHGAMPSDSSVGPPVIPPSLEFLGLVGMIDPLRPGVRGAVAACHEAGLQVCMVTGDHPVTARSIGKQLGLVEDDDRVVSGADLDHASDADLDALINEVSIFARIAPHMKLRLVEAAQRQGHFVAVTGDGVNDAPALRKANVGVAMGRSGTDVAREASELVISDDNFATIVAGVEEGRVAYDNVRKVIYLLISTGAAEVVLVIAAVACGLPLPLLPVQLLWLNLVTNGIQDVALAFEPGEGDVLRRLPRPPSERIFNRIMIERTIVAALVMGGVGLAAFVWMLESGWSVPAAQNVMLLLFVLFENIHIGNCRSETQSALKLSPLKSPLLLGGAALALAIHVAAMHTPLGQHILGTESLNMANWIATGMLAMTVFVAMEIHKILWAKRQQQKSR